MDVVMALCWALACGFSAFSPYWYVIWIIIVIAQRSSRDIRHCRAKYGDEWNEYEKLCPYLFIPVQLLLDPQTDNSIFGKVSLDWVRELVE
jgi:protein-S-isoprenylcysteine O-methyltransferase Ste14